MKELKNIWRLLREGDVKTEKRSLKQMVFFVLKMLLFLVLFNFISVVLIYLLSFLNVLELPNYQNRNYTYIERLLLSSVYAPILEELTFRLPLRFSKRNFIIASMGFILIFSRFLIEMEYFHSAILSISIGIILYFVLNKKIIDALSNFWLNNKILIFYSLLLIFSFWHLGNYDITTELLMFSPIIILPQFLGGLLLSYIRLNSGLLLAICFHSFTNGILSIIVRQ